MIPVGWNSQMDASDTQYALSPDQGAMKETEIIPAGWNSERESNNHQCNPGPVEDHGVGRDDS